MLGFDRGRRGGGGVKTGVPLQPGLCCEALNIGKAYWCWTLAAKTNKERNNAPGSTRAGGGKRRDVLVTLGIGKSMMMVSTYVLPWW